jgi:hypothetical protein
LVILQLFFAINKIALASAFLGARGWIVQNKRGWIHAITVVMALVMSEQPPAWRGREHAK